MDEKVISAKEAALLNEQGRLAAIAGLHLASCPYSAPSEQRDAWVSGWSEGMSVLLES